MDAGLWPGAVAVSGGGDSLALMHLLADWAKAQKRVAPVVLIVDHRLREGSSKDAKQAARWAREAGLESHVLVWRGDKPDGDVEAAAREARYSLMGTWCRKHGLGFLYVAHTLEDQAETFLLRLARGSGLDGLSAMRSPSPFPGFDNLKLVRPLLAMRRAELRSYLESRGQGWLEDPMNGDPRFARVKMRRAAPELAELGLTPERLAAAASHLGRARAALERDVELWLSKACRFEASRALVDGAALAEAPREIALRALAHILGRISGHAYRPRFERLERLYAAILQGGGAARTLHGCRIGKPAKRDAIFGPGTLTIVRERVRISAKEGQVPD
ncbi:MAG TPA: tRNA lysidine(34) synthetase TilS [Rhizomicrobium sp.]|jgi:tRNA(Ile)-lysidine synthase